jgi:hypothetical protein
MEEDVLPKEVRSRVNVDKDFQDKDVRIKTHVNRIRAKMEAFV